MRNKKPHKYKLKAYLNSYAFEVEVIANIKSSTLEPEEMNKVQRKLRNELANSMAKLPFCDAYPNEVEHS